ncbi:CTTNBP2 [Symbiodinium sp. CCMP2592]|nr:CTTNBP2 [Symbiodinium sp. CCMP2592]
MLRITWMLSGEEVASFSVEELSEVKAIKQELYRNHHQPVRFRQKLFLCGNPDDPLDDSVLLDSPMELQLVLLPYSGTSETEAEALRSASACGSLCEVEAMLQLPQHPDIADRDGFTSLMKAAQNGHEEVVRLLLEAGAAQDLANNTGFTALMMASVNDHVEVVQVLLHGGSDINLANYVGFTALMLASFRGYAEVVRLLLDAGADKNLRVRNGKTALMLAFESGAVEVVRLLEAPDVDKNST